MLVLANGAFKSGSTWLRDIILQLRPFEPIPKQFQHPDLPHWVDQRKLRSFLSQCDHRTQSYLSKAHLYDPGLRDALLADESVRVFNIKRDIRDVLVSHYFHVRRMNKFVGDFANYYWRLGRLKAWQMRQYHEVWSAASPRLYSTSFELLKNSFVDEVQRIANFLGVVLSDDRIAEIQQETSLQRLQEKRGEAGKPEAERFFRRGVIGDWKTHFDQEMLDDLAELESSGLGFAEALKYKLIFEYRLRLKRFLLGRGGVSSAFLNRW
ncbi:MAG: sulfotransferase domain-containing protein [Candidatus Entotheonellia bacterium]